MNGNRNGQRRVVVLGAGGYLGSALCRFLRALPGYSVTAVMRHAPGHAAFDAHVTADAFADDWAEKIAAPAPFALINCAYDFAAAGEGEPVVKYARLERNLAALRAKVPVRLINISTMSAYRGCRTDYGREKLAIEALFAKHDGINVRPGLVASWRHPGAAMLRLIDVTRNTKFFPLLTARGAGFYLCDLEALLLGLYALLAMRLNKPHTLSFCYERRFRLGEIERLIELRYKIRRPRIPVPWLAAYLSMRVKEALFGKGKIRTDSVIDFAFPATQAPHREAFARLIEAYRGELEALGRVEGVPDGFYFLDGPASGKARSCRLKRTLGQAPLAALGRLTDA